MCMNAINCPFVIQCCSLSHHLLQRFSQTHHPRRMNLNCHVELPEQICWKQHVCYGLIKSKLQKKKQCLSKLGGSVTDHFKTNEAWRFPSRFRGLVSGGIIYNWTIIYNFGQKDTYTAYIERMILFKTRRPFVSINL